MTNTPPPTIPASEFAARRAKFLRQMHQDGIAIVIANHEQLRNNDTEYPFRQNSDFYYLTGFPEPEAVAVLMPQRTEGEYILFSRPRDAAAEIWTGARIGQEEASKHYGVDTALPLSDLDEMLPKLLSGRKQIYYAFGENSTFDNKLLSWLQHARKKTRAGIHAPDSITHSNTLLHEMRLRKSEAELNCMRAASDISSQAHLSAITACQPELFEYQLEAKLWQTFYQHGSRLPAYNPIVGSGANSCILHYTQNNARLKSGDLVLIDAACEIDHYAADITRTFPVNGQFSTPQKEIYQIVLQTQQAVIAAIRPGLPWDELQQIASKVITEGLTALNLLQGNVSELMALKAYRQFYMHNIGHWLGMDVHDVGTYTQNGQSRCLEPGMVLTVEPGIYIPAESANVPEAFWNIGIRIEDDVVVTEHGYEVLTSAVPKTMAEIEALMQ